MSLGVLRSGFFVSACGLFSQLGLLAPGESRITLAFLCSGFVAIVYKISAPPLRLQLSAVEAWSVDALDRLRAIVREAYRLWMDRPRLAIESARPVCLLLDPPPMFVHLPPSPSPRLLSVFDEHAILFSVGIIVMYISLVICVRSLLRDTRDDPEECTLDDDLPNSPPIPMASIGLPSPDVNHRRRMQKMLGLKDEDNIPDDFYCFPADIHSSSIESLFSVSSVDIPSESESEVFSPPAQPMSDLTAFLLSDELPSPVPPQNSPTMSDLDDDNNNTLFDVYTSCITSPNTPELPSQSSQPFLPFLIKRKPVLEPALPILTVTPTPSPDFRDGATDVLGSTVTPLLVTSESTSTSVTERPTTPIQTGLRPLSEIVSSPSDQFVPPMALRHSDSVRFPGHFSPAPGSHLTPNDGPVVKGMRSGLPGIAGPPLGALILGSVSKGSLGEANKVDKKDKENWALEWQM